jgi:hypothetical protein
LIRPAPGAVAPLLRLAAVAALLGVLAALSGCGGGCGTSVTPAEPIDLEGLATAASTSTEAATGRFAFSLEATMPGATQSLAFPGDSALKD